MLILDKTTILQLIAAGFGLGSAASGFYAALLWKRASLAHPTPYWYADPMREPVDEKLRDMGWLGAQLEASFEAGHLNRRAAWWTGLAAALAALGTIIGVILIFSK
jgi:hypothetical protein